MLQPGIGVVEVGDGDIDVVGFAPYIRDPGDKAWAEALLDFGGPLPDIIVEVERAVAVGGLEVAQHDRIVGRGAGIGVAAQRPGRRRVGPVVFQVLRSRVRRVQVQDAEVVDLLRVVELPGAGAQHHRIGETIGNAEPGHDLQLVDVI